MQPLDRTGTANDDDNVERTALIEVLGVSHDPSTGEVRRARRRVARALHPDTHDDATDQMAEVNSACDLWLAEIRARRHAVPTPPEPATAPRQTGSQPSPPRIANNDALFLATASIPVLVVFLAGASVAVVGFSIASLAAGVLLGLGMGGMFVVTALVSRDRARQRSNHRPS